MWYLVLPDILVYLTIFGGGFLTGVISVFITVLVYCSGGGTIKIQFTSDKDNIKDEEF
tara:strand:+ start:193 stop:366 length:174 start_codon:yes stop_codon:yes gene_type:complete